MSFFLKILVLNALLTSALFAQHIPEGISVISVSSKEDDRIYYMDALIDTHLPDYIIQAVYGGVPLPLLLQIEVNEKNNWWLDTTLVTIEQRYLLRYFPLLDSIKLNILSDGSSVTFGSFKAAFKKIGSIKRFPILDEEHFPNNGGIYARIRLKIDRTSLPKPLRTESLLGGSWDIASDWKKWTVR